MKRITAILITVILSEVFLASLVFAGVGAPPYNPANVKITGGTINNAPIGATIPATGAFTALSGTMGTLSGRMDLRTNLAEGFGLRIRADETDATSILQITNNAGTVQLATLSYNNTGTAVFSGAISGTTITGTTITGTTINSTTDIKINGKLLISATAPTILSGFGTSPFIGSSNGSAAFVISIGTGGTASTGTVSLPAAYSGWNCKAEATIFTANTTTITTGTTTTTLVLTNFTISTGAQAAWPEYTNLFVTCLAF